MNLSRINLLKLIAFIVTLIIFAIYINPIIIPISYCTYNLVMFLLSNNKRFSCWLNNKKYYKYILKLTKI